jgi:hypothetical protein
MQPTIRLHHNLLAVESDHIVHASRSVVFALGVGRATARPHCDANQARRRRLYAEFGSTSVPA